MILPAANNDDARGPRDEDLEQSERLLQDLSKLRLRSQCLFEQFKVLRSQLTEIIQMTRRPDE